MWVSAGSAARRIKVLQWKYASQKNVASQSVHLPEEVLLSFHRDSSKIQYLKANKQTKKPKNLGFFWGRRSFLNKTGKFPSVKQMRRQRLWSEHYSHKGESWNLLLSPSSGKMVQWNWNFIPEGKIPSKLSVLKNNTSPEMASFSSNFSIRHFLGDSITYFHTVE